MISLLLILVEMKLVLALQFLSVQSSRHYIDPGYKIELRTERNNSDPDFIEAGVKPYRTLDLEFYFQGNAINGVIGEDRNGQICRITKAYIT